jgi:hypothetical protein
VREYCQRIIREALEAATQALREQLAVICANGECPGFKVGYDAADVDHCDIRILEAGEKREQELEQQLAQRTLERDAAREQFDRHVDWASEQIKETERQLAQTTQDRDEALGLAAIAQNKLTWADDALTAQRETTDRRIEELSEARALADKEAEQLRHQLAQAKSLELRPTAALLLQHLDDWAKHERACQVERCGTCEAAFNLVLRAHAAWERSRAQAEVAQQVHQSEHAKEGSQGR